MNILITGAGLIGCHLARRVVNAGDKAILYDLSPNREFIETIAGKDAAIIAADLRDLPALIHTLKQFGVDTIVHTAGLIGTKVAENSYTGSTNNLLGTIHVLEAARLHGIKRVVYVSTFGVYDRARIHAGPVREDAPVAGHNLYTATKLCSEHLVHAYTELYRLDTIIIRPAGVFGRGHYAGGSTVGMIMRDLALSAARGEPFTIDAKTYAANEYVYAKDVAFALDLASRAQNPGKRTYNAGSGVVTGPSDLAQIVRELAPNADVQIVGSEDSRKPFPLDLSSSKTELGYSPQFSMKEALRDYIEGLR